jgi:hypothetical protein
MPTQTFPLYGPINLECRFGHGSLTVRAEDDLTEASVTVTARNPDADAAGRTTAEMRGPTLTVHGPKPQGGIFDLPLFTGRSGGRGALDIDIVVPSGTACKVVTMAADVTFSGRIGSADLAGGASAISADVVDGDLRVRHGSGPIRIGKVTGSVTVRGGSSSLSVAESGGVVEAAFGSGSLDLGTTHGPVRLRAGSGSVSIANAENDVDLTAGSGPFTICLADGRQARLDVVTGSGQLHSEMPVEQTPREGGRVVSIKAKTGNGDVTIRRASAGQPAS